MNNYVHDNNNPNVPRAGAAGAGPVGTGMTVSGGRNDTIIHNRFVNNNAWGIAIVAYPDIGPPCTGGTFNSPLLGNGSCLYDDWGNALISNTFSHNGGYGNPTNGDFEQLNLETHPTRLLPRQHRHERAPEQRRRGAGGEVSDLLVDAGLPEHQRPVPERGPV